jgi:excisionase family DNA binding protein
MREFMAFAEGLLTKQQVIKEFGIPKRLEAKLFAILKPTHGLYRKKDVDPALDTVWEAENRPPSASDEFSFEKEDFKVNVMTQAAEPFERIALGIERLIEVFIPRVEVPENSVVEMFTPAQAAKKMGLHVQTVREWCREGKLGVRTGRKWLISPDEVKQYLRGQLLIKGRVAG